MANGIRVAGPMTSEYEEVLSPEALAFVERLHREFNPRREELLRLREERQAAILAGGTLDFLPETREVREGDWSVAPAPADLNDRRVEITGPVERKMVINALNSGARVFMADFEDANSPTWANVVEGQRNLRDAVRRTIAFQNPDGRRYELKEETATLVVRPRGWHLPERHVEVDGQPVSGSLFDFGLYFFHNATELIARGSGPYFTFPSCRATWRRASGTTSSARRRTRSASRAGRSGRRCCSRRSGPPSRWTRSSMNCASTPPG